MKAKENILKVEEQKEQLGIKQGINYFLISQLNKLENKKHGICDLEALAMVASVHALHESPPEIGGFGSATRSSAPTFRGNLKNLNSTAGGQKK